MPSRESSRFLSTEVLVENKWHRYCRDRFRQTDGSEGEYYHIDMTGACGTIPLFEDGTIRPVMDETFPLDRAADAHRRMEAGEHIGKIVLKVADD